MTTTLSKTRNMTMDDAMGMMKKLAVHSCNLAIIKARKKLKLIEVNAEFEAKMANDQKEAITLTRRIENFCRANKHCFTKPRKIKTDDGTFGLHKCSDLVIDNEEDLIETLERLGMTDCIEVTKKVDKKAIRRLMEDGKRIIGCSIRTSENEPVVKVSSKMLKAAIEENT